MSKHPHNHRAFANGTRELEVRQFLSKRQLRKLITWPDSRVLQTIKGYEVVLYPHDT